MPTGGEGKRRDFAQNEVIPQFATNVIIIAFCVFSVTTGIFFKSKSLSLPHLPLSELKKVKRMEGGIK